MAMRVLTTNRYGMKGSGSTPAYLYQYNADLSRQRGTGIGSIFSSLYNSVAPLVKTVLGLGARAARTGVGQQVAKSVKKNAMKAGLNVVQDALKGENVLRSTKRNIKQAGGDVLGDMLSKKPRTRRAPRKPGKKKPRASRAARNKKFARTIFS